MTGATELPGGRWRTQGRREKHASHIAIDAAEGEWAVRSSAWCWSRAAAGLPAGPRSSGRHTGISRQRPQRGAAWLGALALFSALQVSSSYFAQEPVAPWRLGSGEKGWHLPAGADPVLLGAPPGLPDAMLHPYFKRPDFAVEESLWDRYIGAGAPPPPFPRNKPDTSLSSPRTKHVSSATSAQAPRPAPAPRASTPHDALRPSPHGTPDPSGVRQRGGGGTRRVWLVREERRDVSS